jgi:hypothetical protein
MSSTNKGFKPYENPCDMSYSNKNLNILDQILPPKLNLYNYIKS